MTIGMIIAGAVCLLIVARTAAHQQHPIRSVIASAVCGLAGLSAVALLSPVTGFLLPFNTFTAVCAVILGLPGVILLLALKLILL